MNEIFAIPPGSVTVDAAMTERLRQAADATAAWDVIPRPASRSNFGRRVDAARKALRHLELSLARQPLPASSSDPEITARRSAMLELGASYRLFRTAIAAVSDDPRTIAQLPRLQHSEREDEPRIAAVARAYMQAVDGIYSALTFSAFVRLVQSIEPLNINELWNFGTFLRFTLVEMLLGDSGALFRAAGGAPAPRLVDRIRSLRDLSNADWTHLVEPLIAFDVFLRQDPAGAYHRMDLESRELCRRRVAELARRSDCTEGQVAQIVLELAQGARKSTAANPRVKQKREHVGYYLLDRGFSQLANRIGFHPSLAWRARQFVRNHAEDFFLNGIVLLTLFFMAAVFFPILQQVDGIVGLLAILILLWLPASQDAVDLINNAITAYFDPEPLPKLDFKDGIPRECTTLVAIPTLLHNEKQVRKLINDLEVRFLGNRDPNLRYALLTDSADSVSKPRESDGHPLVELAMKLIGELNAKYASPRHGAFLLLHRHRVFNIRQGVWMGWERKRGKLLDLNKLLTGEFDAFPIKAGPVAALENVRYVLTLDADSQLPHGAAARLVGAIAHPLNQAVIDPRLRLVTRASGFATPYRCCGAIHGKLAAGGHLLWPGRTRSLRARRFRRLSRPLRRRHVYGKGNL